MLKRPGCFPKLPRIRRTHGLRPVCLAGDVWAPWHMAFGAPWHLQSRFFCILHESDLRPKPSPGGPSPFYGTFPLHLKFPIRAPHHVCLAQPASSRSRWELRWRPRTSLPALAGAQPHHSGQTTISVLAGVWPGLGQVRARSGFRAGSGPGLPDGPPGSILGSKDQTFLCDSLPRSCRTKRTPRAAGALEEVAVPEEAEAGAADPPPTPSAARAPLQGRLRVGEGNVQRPGVVCSWPPTVTLLCGGPPPPPPPGVFGGCCFFFAGGGCPRGLAKVAK